MSDRDREDMQKYLEMIESDSQGDRVEAAREMGRFDGEEVEGALEKVLDDVNFVLQAAAEKSLQRIHQRKKFREDERRKLAEKEKPDAVPEVDLSLLTEDEKEHIRQQELTRLEEAKRVREYELKQQDEFRKRDTAERLKEDERRRLEEEKRKAEALLREKIRKEASTQIGLVEFEGEMLTPEEVELRKADQKQKEEIRHQAILRKKKREESIRRELISSNQKFENFFLHLGTATLGLFLLVTILIIVNKFAHFASKGMAVLMFIMMCFFLAGSLIILWQLMSLEGKINKSRIITIDKDTWTFNVELSTHPLARLIRRAVFALNPSLKKQFSPKKSKETKE